MSTAAQNFPPEFLARLKQIVPPGLMTGVLKGYSEPRLTTFRVNTLKADAARVIKELAHAGVICEPALEVPGAFVVKKGSFKKLTESRPYDEGWMYVQSLSSQVPPLVLNPQPGETVLDMAAAPGGKTCQMAAMMRGEGKITALDPDPIRFERLKFNIEKQGANLVCCLNLPGERLPADLHGRCDRVLLDAPCSSEGTFLASERKSFAHWSVEYVQGLAKRQKKLLAAAHGAVKEGGVIVYSTCALSPDENEAVLHWGLTNLPGLTLMPIALKNPYLKPPLATWAGERFHPSVAHARRIYPSERMEGFFVAVLLKR